MGTKEQEILKQIGKELATLRVQKGISQEALAHTAGLHRAYVGKVERGEKNLTIKTLLKITSALEVTVEVKFL
jgi:XRE family transcriptional regulator, regulator of sulfur utilization